MSFKKEDIPWSDKLIMICSKCGAKTSTPDCSDRMKSELKSEIKENGLKENIRAVTTSCLNICPEGRVAIVTIDRQTGDQRAVTVEPDYKAKLKDF